MMGSAPQEERTHCKYISIVCGQPSYLNFHLNRQATEGLEDGSGGTTNTSRINNCIQTIYVIGINKRTGKISQDKERKFQ